MRPVMLDLAVHKAIEARRRTFDESANDILRRALGLSGPVSSSPADIVPKVRQSRQGGHYRISFIGRSFEAPSLKGCLREVLLAAEEEQPGFLARLARFQSRKGRRIVASRAHDLYPNSPQLIQDHAERLKPGWWYDTNVSRKQCVGYFREIGRVADLDEPIFDA